MKLLVIIFLIFSYMTKAADFTSVTSGSWNDPLIWDLSIEPDSNPTEVGDVITVTHNVVLTGNLIIRSGSTLIIESCDTLIVNGDVSFNNGSSLLVMSCAVFIVTGDVTNSNNSNDITINGTIQIAGNYVGGNGSELVGAGDMEIDGSITTSGSGAVFGSTEDCLSDCDNSAFSALPIELISFACKSTEVGVELLWVTASEQDCDYYEIEKSIDGVNFNSIGSVYGAGSTNEESSYKFTDFDRNVGLSYYRLKQYDFDGSVNDLGIISINIELEDNHIIYPNPVSTGNSVYVSFKSQKDELVSYQLLNLEGKLIIEGSINSNKGSNTLLLISDSDLLPGIYTVVLVANGNRDLKKLTVY